MCASPLKGADLYSMYFRYVSPLERRKNFWIEAVNQEYVSLFLIMKQLLSNRQSIGTHLIPTYRSKVEERRINGKHSIQRIREPNTLLPHTK